MLKSSKPVRRKVDDDKEDTDGPRGLRGYRRGETSEGKASPRTAPARNKAGRQMRNKAPRERETPRAQQSQEGMPGGTRMMRKLNPRAVAADVETSKGTGTPGRRASGASQARIAQGKTPDVRARSREEDASFTRCITATIEPRGPAQAKVEAVVRNR